MINRILFAADLSAFTSHALLHVEELARQFKASVCLVHVVPPIGKYASAVVRKHCSPEVQTAVLGRSEKNPVFAQIREEVFEELVKHDSENISSLLPLVSDIVVTSGSPASSILEQAQEHEADLIVVGSHGADSAKGRVVGSVATRVLQLSKIPVFFIPMMEEVKTHAPAEFTQGKLFNLNF